MFVVVKAMTGNLADHLSLNLACAFVKNFVRDTISESILDFLQKSQTPVQALWSLRNIDLRVIAFHLFIVNLRMPQSVSLVLLINEPIRVNMVNIISFVIYNKGNSQYPERS